MKISLIPCALLVLTCSVAAQTSWVQNPGNGRWYRLTAAKTWQAAEAEAVGEGGHLATIRTLDEHRWLIGQFGRSELWIGLNDAASEGNFVWSSGEPSAFRYWCGGEPNGGQGGPDEDHVQLTDWCIDLPGGWNDQQGTDVLPGIIEIATAPNGWFQSPVNGHWYRLTDPATWADAEAEAVSEGGHLVTLRDQAERDWAVGQFGTREFWTGLNDAAVEGTFVWTSGESFGYSDWCVGEPSASTVDTDFVRFDSGCGGWDDVEGGGVIAGLIERETAPGSGFRSFGSGCAGGRGVPMLDSRFGSTLRVGGRFDLVLDNVSPIGIVTPFMTVGFDDDTWEGLSLPVSLDSIGMTGCSLFIDADLIRPMARQGATAEWSSAVPNDLQLVGIEVFFQAFVTEPGANAFGAIVSNAGRATIGR